MRARESAYVPHATDPLCGARETQYLKTRDALQATANSMKKTSPASPNETGHPVEALCHLRGAAAPYLQSPVVATREDLPALGNESSHPIAMICQNVDAPHRLDIPDPQSPVLRA